MKIFLLFLSHTHGMNTYYFNMYLTQISYIIFVFEYLFEHYIGNYWPSTKSDHDIETTVMYTCTLQLNQYVLLPLNPTPVRHSRNQCG